MGGDRRKNGARAQPAASDPSSEDERCVAKFSGGNVQGLAYARVGDESLLLLSAGDGNGSLRVRDARDPGGAARELAGHRQHATSVVAAGRGAGGAAGNVLAASCSGDGTVRLWGCERGAAKGEQVRGLHTLETSNGDWLKCVDLTPDAARVVAGGTSKSVAGGWDGCVHVWTRRSAGAAAAASGADAYAAIALSGHTGEVSAVAVSRTGERVVSASGDGTVRVWRVPMDAANGPSHKRVSWADGDKLRFPRALALAADAQTVYVADWGRSDIALVDCESAQEVAVLRSDSVHSGVFCLALLESRGGGASGRLFAGHGNGVISEWDLAARTCSAVYGDPQRYTERVTCITARFLEQASDLGDAVARSGSTRAKPRVTGVTAINGGGREGGGALCGAGQSRVEFAAGYSGGVVRGARTVRVWRASSGCESGENSAADAGAVVDDSEDPVYILGEGLMPPPPLSPPPQRLPLWNSVMSSVSSESARGTPPSTSSCISSSLSPSPASPPPPWPPPPPPPLATAATLSPPRPRGPPSFSSSCISSSLSPSPASPPPPWPPPPPPPPTAATLSPPRPRAPRDPSFDLLSHVTAVHDRLRDHACPHCQSAFAKRSNLMRHISRLHGGRTGATPPPQHPARRGDGASDHSSAGGRASAAAVAAPPPSAPPPAPRGAGAFGGGGLPSSSRAPDKSSGGVSATAVGARDLMMRTIQVPNSCVGTVIGPNGDKIRDLQTLSGATIKVMPDKDVRPGADSRPILISGNARAIRSAETLVNTVVQDSESRHCALGVATAILGGVARGVGSLDGSDSADGPVGAAGDAVSLGMDGGGRMASRSSGEAHAGGYSTLETDVLAVQKTCVLGREGTTILDPLEGSVTCVHVDTELDVSHLSPSSPGTRYGPSSCIDVSRRIISGKPAEFLHRSPAVRLSPHLAGTAAGYARLIHIWPSVRSNPPTPRATYLRRAFAKRIELAPPRELWLEPGSEARDSAKAFDLVQRALDGTGKCAARPLALVSDTDKVLLQDMSEACKAFWLARDLLKMLVTEQESRWSSARFLGPWRFVFFGDKVPPRVFSWPDARGLWFKGEHPPHGCSASAATPERNSCECGPPAILCIDDGDAIQPQGSAWSGTGAKGSSSGEDQNDESTQNSLPESGDGAGSSSGEDRNDNSDRNALPESGSERVGNEGDKDADEEQREKRRKWARQKREQRAKLRQDPKKLAASREIDRGRKRDAALRKVAGEVIDDVCSGRPAREKPPDRVSRQSHGQVVHHPHSSHMKEQVVSSERELEQPHDHAQPMRLDSTSVQTPEQRKIAELEKKNEQLWQENKRVREENARLRKDSEEKGLKFSALYDALLDVVRGANFWQTFGPLLNWKELVGPSPAPSNPRFSATAGDSRHDPYAQYSAPAGHPDPSVRTLGTGQNASEAGSASAGALFAQGYYPAVCRNENLGYARLGPGPSSPHIQDESQGAALNPSGSTATPRAAHLQARDPQLEAPDHSAGRPSAAPSLDWGFGETGHGSGRGLPHYLTQTLPQLPAAMNPQASQTAGAAIAAPLSAPGSVPSPSPFAALLRNPRRNGPLLGPQDLASPPDDDDDDDDDDDFGDGEDFFRSLFP